ncbi:NAD dependent epimerase/dehydratase family protein [mine drainage metagenome]|uniref:NAD dependent epimerase/dehydratase family protein n=1 Tax=mine drainage metagenome TaxID=410659 RepID=A0A1J5SXH8_9ZZZZ
MSLHTILGAGGSISNYLVPVLLENKEQVRLVSRSQKNITGTENIVADLTNAAQTTNAVKGSSVVYLLVGLEYNIKAWKEQWPVIMTNVINACSEANAKLIFFDNVYMYGKVHGAMTEETAFNPCSRKGEVRVAIATQLLNAMKTKKVNALIARSADFYGPGGDKTSAANIMVFTNLAKKKTSQCLVNANQPHSFTYIPDAAKALYLLAKDETAFNQTWHLPTRSNPLTGKQFIELAAKEFNQPPKFMVFPKWMINVLGLFMPVMKEMYEMLYQNELAYIFDSTKFENYFHFIPTSYEDGIKATAEYYLKK